VLVLNEGNRDLQKRVKVRELDWEEEKIIGEEELEEGMARLF